MIPNRIPEHDRIKSGGSALALAALVACLVTGAVFSSALRYDFVYWDDTPYLFGNAPITSLDGELVAWAFGFRGLDLLWFPVTWLSFALDYRIWGLHPFGFHLTNILLHSCNASLAVIVAHRIFIRVFPAGKEPDEERRRSTVLLLTSLAAGLLFALHPLRVESVAWISERKDVLSGFFGLLSLLAYLSYAEGRGGWGSGQAGKGRPYYVAALVLFFLAANSKPMLVTLPVVFVILDRFPLVRIAGFRDLVRSIGEKIPFFFVSGAVSAMTLVTFRPGMDNLAQIPFSTRLLVASSSTLKYLLRTLWPSGLSPLYLYPREVSFSNPAFSGALVAVAGITLLAVACRRSSWGVLAAWLCYLVTLVPVLGIFQNGVQESADRFTYVPSLAITLLFCGALASPLLRNPGAGLPAARAVPVALLVLACLGTSIVLTRQLLPVWTDTETLWTRVITLNPEAGKALYERGLFYLDVRKDYRRALADLDASVEVARKKNFRGAGAGDLYFVRGRALMALGEYERAAGDFTAVLSYPARSADRYPNALLGRASAWEALGRLDRAVADRAAASAGGGTAAEGGGPKP